ncbi:MAG: O-antigen ligase family protein [Armatimonadota bacterium]
MEQIHTSTIPTTPKDTDPLGRLIFVLAVLALALAPTQLSIMVRHFPLHPAELVLMLAAAAWAVRWLSVRDTRSLPPLSHWLVVLTTLLGIFAMYGFRNTLQPSVAKETVRTVMYLLIAVTVFRAVFTTPQRLRIAVIALLATTTLAVALGVVQRLRLDHNYIADRDQRVVFDHFTPTAYTTVQTPIYVASTFGAWNDHGFHPSRIGYAGFLGLLLPFALALLVTERRRPGIALWIGAVFLGAAISLLAGFVVLAILFGLLATGLALGMRTGRWVTLGVLAYLLVVAGIGGFNRTEVLQEPFKLTVATPDSPDGPLQLKKFWGEQQAALNLIRHYPLLGVGAGRYQAQINEAYDLLGAVASQRLEPEAQNGYLLTAVNSGLLGLAAMLALLGGYLTLAWRQWRGNPANPWAAAALGAMIVLLAMMLVSNPWIRGTMVLISALLAIIGNGVLEKPKRNDIHEK